MSEGVISVEVAINQGAAGEPVEVVRDSYHVRIDLLQTETAEGVLEAVGVGAKGCVVRGCVVRGCVRIRWCWCERVCCERVCCERVCCERVCCERVC